MWLLPSVLWRRFTVRSISLLVQKPLFYLYIWGDHLEQWSQTQDVVSITAPFMIESNIHLIQSSKNYCCIIWLAVTSQMKNDLNSVWIMMSSLNPIISRFVSKYEEYMRSLSCSLLLSKSLWPQEFWDNPDYGYYRKFFEQDLI